MKNVNRYIDERSPQRQIRLGHLPLRWQRSRQAAEEKDVWVGCRSHRLRSLAHADTTFRMWCITVGNSPSFNTATLFDTDAQTSFVNRRFSGLYTGRTVESSRSRVPGPWAETTQVSLAGTSHTSDVLGNWLTSQHWRTSDRQLHRSNHY